MTVAAGAGATARPGVECDSVEGFRAERAAKRGELTAEKRHVLTVAGDVAGIECFHDVLLSMCDRRRPNEAGARGVGGGMA